jgi:ABC-type dipeptide/oligopeptide/nickel transport system permease subunit
MVAEGATFIVSGEWWLALFPGTALMLAVFCFNLLGDGAMACAIWSTHNGGHDGHPHPPPGH